MKSTKDKIIQAAIELFNQYGVGNVKVHDIADFAGISAGNLTYHYKKKNQLMLAVYQYMLKDLEEMTLGKEIFQEATESVILTRDYLKFKIQFRFFYRDTLEIIKLCPEIKLSYQKLLRKIINFNKTVLFLSVGKGYLKPEPHEGHYEILAKNNWAVLNSWLTEHEILGKEAVDITDGVRAVLELYFPYFTEKGLKFYYKNMEELSNWIEKDMLD